MTAEISIDIADSRWEQLAFDDLVIRATETALAHLDLTEDCELSILACDDARIAELNTEFRGKSVPTNVLSWPAEERGADAPGARPDLPEPDMFGTVELGDIAISYDTCAREAAEAGKPLADHTTHLVVHGVLHLLGYDHIRDLDATLMEGLEVEILGKLGVPDPYYRED